MAERAYITPEVIKWARTTANISVEDAARLIGVKPERLLEWENNQSYPTVKQAIKMADKYKRPFAAFFLPEPPKDFALLQDFRRSSNKSEYSTALIFMLREIQEKQRWMSEFLRENGEYPLPFIGQFSIKDSTSRIAKEIKDYLNIEENETSSLKIWIQKAEARGIFVSKAGAYHSHSKIHVSEVRGFAIADKYAPFVFINSRDRKTSQLFTLVHELVHLWIDESGISDALAINFRSTNVEYNEIEVFCNRAAAEALMPQEDINKNFHNSVSDSLLDEMVDFIAPDFGVSKLALWTRLYNLKYITYPRYREILDRYNNIFSEDIKRKVNGGDSNRTLAVRNSKTFCYIVIDSFKNGLISGIEASNILGVRLNKLDKFATYL